MRRNYVGDFLHDGLRLRDRARRSTLLQQHNLRLVFFCRSTEFLKKLDSDGKGFIHIPETETRKILVQIPEEVVRLLIKNDSVALIGSVDKAGVPNISPRFVLGIIGDNNRLLFADLYENKTFSNLSAWNKVTASIIDKDTMGGFQLKGDASEVTDGELVSLANSKLKEHGFGSKPHRVWVLDVKEIFSSKPSADSKAPLIPAYG